MIQTGYIEEELLDEIWTLLDECWCYDPWDRPTAAALELGLGRIRAMKSEIESRMLEADGSPSHSGLTVCIVLPSTAAAVVHIPLIRFLHLC